MQLKWTDLLKRKLLGQTIETTDHEGKFYVRYDALEIKDFGGGALEVSFSLKGETLFKWEAVILLPGSTLTLTGLRGEQEIQFA